MKISCLKDCIADSMLFFAIGLFSYENLLSDAEKLFTHAEGQMKIKRCWLSIVSDEKKNGEGQTGDKKNPKISKNSPFTLLLLNFFRQESTNIASTWLSITTNHISTKSKWRKCLWANKSKWVVFEIYDSHSLRFDSPLIWVTFIDFAPYTIEFDGR